MTRRDSIIRQLSFDGFKDSTKDHEATLSSKEAAKLLGVSTATVQNWRRADVLKATWTGSSYVYDVEAVEALLTNKNDFRRLESRANRTSAQRLELMSKSQRTEFAGVLAEYLLKNDDVVDRNSVMFASAVKYVSASCHTDFDGPEQYLEFISQLGNGGRNCSAEKEMATWYEIVNSTIVEEVLGLTKGLSLDDQDDPLGELYQCITSVGQRASTGLYYTPMRLVRRALKEVPVGSRVADLSCGSGRFLVHLARARASLEGLMGIDSDPIAVRIARINLTLAVPYAENPPAIYCADGLVESWGCAGGQKWDYIVGNPPWGAANSLDRSTLDSTCHDFTKIRSGESASLFVVAGIKNLKPNGRLVYVLPEAMLEAEQHRDIRSLLLSKSSIHKIEYLGKPFGKVMSRTVVVELSNTMPKSGGLVGFVDGSTVTRHAEQESYRLAKHQKITMPNDEFVEGIHQKIRQAETHVLPLSAQWAMGIVTGNNQVHLSDDNQPANSEPIYRGKEVLPLQFTQPKSFIVFTPSSYQQVAPINLYRASEKLVYRFICNRLVFAYDDQQRLVLNSANILIPNDQVPIKVICLLFNSSLYRFYYRTLFRTVKVLKSNLQALPIPNFDDAQILYLEGIADKLIRGAETSLLHEAERIIYQYFSISHSESLMLEQKDARWNS